MKGRKKIFSVALIITVSLGLASVASSAEKLVLGTGIKESPRFYLPILAGLEKGFWKQNGLEVEWLPFRGDTLMFQAMTARSLNLAFSTAISVVPAVASGVPIFYIAETQVYTDFRLWVRAGSRIKEPKDLRGATLGVAQLGVPSHRFGLMIAKANGIEKDVKFVAAGGVVEVAAGIKAGHLDGTVQPLVILINLKLKGEVQELVAVADYLPKPWMENALLSRKDFAKNNPEIMRQVVRALMQSISFLRENPRWAIEKMKSEGGFSEEAGKALNEVLIWTKDGKINRKAIENLRNFSLEWGMVPKDKAPSVDELYTAEFTG